MARPKGGLGKGLDALFADNTGGSAQMPNMLQISEIEPNKNQPRKEFHQGALCELAESIREHGVVQPIVVRPMASGRYQLVAGERRWRASRMAGLTEVPVVVREMTDQQAMAWALIENLQREDLNPMEEARGFAMLMEQHGLTQEEVAKQVGKSRPVIGNALRLLQLPKNVQDLVREGKLSAGQARSLLGLEEGKLIGETAAEAVAKGWTVRQIEQMVRRHKQGGQDVPGEKTPGGFASEGNRNQPSTEMAREKQSVMQPETNGAGAQSVQMYEDVGKLPKMRDQEIWQKPLLAESQQMLQELFHRKVTIEGSEKRGRICISFYSEDDLINFMGYFSGF